MRIGLCVLVCLVLVAPAVGEPEGTPAVDARALVERLTSMTMNEWSDEDRASLDRAMRVDPRGVLTALVDRLPKGDPVPAPLADSQTYTVCGQALTVLDRLIGENVGGETRDWIGFATRDHRGISPNPATVHAPWLAWLEVRRDAAGPAREPRVDGLHPAPLDGGAPRRGVAGRRPASGSWIRVRPGFPRLREPLSPAVATFS